MLFDVFHLTMIDCSNGPAIIQLQSVSDFASSTDFSSLPDDSTLV